MEAWLKGYVLTVLGASVVALIADCLVPQGSLRRFARFGTAMIVSVAILSPFASFPALSENQTFAAEQAFQPDYTDAVTRTVRAVPGYENASVQVEQDGGRIVSITVRTGGKLLEEAASALTRQYLTQTLGAMFGTDNISLED